MDFFQNYFYMISNLIKNMDTNILEQGIGLITNVAEAKSKVIIVGNGGSAAMASHVSVDLTKNANVRAINFNEADLITCFANDYGYEKWVEKGIEFYADKQDLIILISSSGRSKNIINGALRAKAMGLKVMTFSGFSQENPLKHIGDINFWVNSNEYNMIEMTHHIWLLAMVDKVINDRKFK